MEILAGQRIAHGDPCSMEILLLMRSGGAGYSIGQSLVENVVVCHQDGAPVVALVVLQVSLGNQSIDRLCIDARPFRRRIWKFNDVAHSIQSLSASQRIGDVDCF